MHVLNQKIEKLKNQIKVYETKIKALQSECTHEYKVKKAGWMHTDYICTKCDHQTHDMGV